jgi:hypothetical protein
MGLLAMRLARVPLPSRNFALAEFRNDLGGVSFGFGRERLRRGRDHLLVARRERPRGCRTRLQNCFISLARDAIMETISDFCRSSARDKPEGTDLSQQIHANFAIALASLQHLARD